MNITMNQLTLYNQNLDIIKDGPVWLNRTFLYGEGLFSTIRISNFCPLFLDEHLDRLNKGLQYLYGIDADKSLGKKILNLSAKHLNAKLRVSCFQLSSYQSLIEKEGVVHYFFHVLELDQNFLEASLPVKLCFSESRVSENRVPSFLKSGNYLVSILEKKRALEKGFHDILFLDVNNNMTESTTSNVIFRKGDLFYTAPLSSMVLDGVTRRKVINALQKDFIQIKTQHISKEEVLEMDDCWLLNSVIGIQPVEKIEEKHISSSDQWTKKLKKYLIGSGKK